MGPLYVGKYHSICEDTHRTESQANDELPLCLSRDIYLFLSPDSSFPGSWTQIRMHTFNSSSCPPILYSPVLRLNYTTTFLFPHLADGCELHGFHNLASILISVNKSYFVYIYVCSIGSVSLENPNQG